MKKVLGFILVLIGCFLALAALMGMIQGILVGGLSQDSLSGTIGYLIGSFVGTGIIGVLAFFCIKFGIRLFKSKPVLKPKADFEG